MATRKREHRGFGAIDPQKRRRGIIVPRRKRPPAGDAAPKKKKRETGPGKRRVKRRKKKKEEEFEFPEMKITAKRRKISDIPVGERQPPTVVIGKTFFTKKELAERRKKK